MKKNELELINSEEKVIKYNKKYFHYDGIFLGKDIFYNVEDKYIRFKDNILHITDDRISILIDVFLEHINIPLTISYIMSEMVKKKSDVFEPYIKNNKGKHKTEIGKLISQGKLKSKFIFIFKYIEKDDSREKFSYTLKLKNQNK